MAEKIVTIGQVTHARAREASQYADDAAASLAIAFINFVDAAISEQVYMDKNREYREAVAVEHAFVRLGMLPKD